MPSRPPLTTAGYDIIGDIHGQAGKLRRLLERMGYVERQGVYSHAQRQVIFVGDFIDRGPRQWETLQIARAMVEQGHALAVLGNHEFNALAWATADPEDPSAYLRPHTPKNHRQHAAFLAEVEQDSTRYTQALDWFWSLPVYLDLPELRIIHACWHEDQLASLESSFTEDQQLTHALLVRASRPGSTDYDAIETLLKGVEAPLPDGVVIPRQGRHTAPSRPGALVGPGGHRLSRRRLHRARPSRAAAQHTAPGRHPARLSRYQATLLRPLLAQWSAELTQPKACLSGLQCRTRWPAGGLSLAG